MRTSELLGRTVFDINGVEIGQIRDIRCDEPRSTIGTVDSLAVGSLVVGPSSFGRRLGYTHGDVHGPWLLARSLGWFGRHDRLVPIQYVANFKPDVTLSVSSDALAHPRQRSDRVRS